MEVQENAPGLKARILLVDDQPAKLLTYEAILSDLGEDMVKVGSAREALQHLLAGDFAVILVDACMPEIDGFELAEMIRKHPRFRKTAIILVSAVYMTDFDRLRGYDSGAVDYVPVPIIPEVLRAKVSVFVDLYRKTEELRCLNEDLGRRVAERTSQLEASTDRLRASEERYRAFVANSTEGICCWDLAEPVSLDLPVDRQVALLYQHARVCECNDVMARMCGFDHAGELVGAPLSRVRPPDDPQSAAFVAALVRARYRVLDAEFVEVNNYGQQVYLSSNLMGVIEDGRVLRIWGTHLDVTARKQAEQERVRLLESERLARNDAERSNRLKDEFLAMLSHELRTPISAVMGWVQLIRRGKLEARQFDEALDAIESGVRTQVRLIEDLLDVNRIASGKLGIDKAPLDLNVPLRSAVEMVTPSARAKDLHLQADWSAPHPLAIDGDENRLQQVFCNLLNNAIKFTPAGGDIVVDMGTDNGHAVVTVTDTGRGIQGKELTQIFERFWQADRSITRKYGGLGLGLHLCRHLVEQHSGSIRAESDGERRGSKFIVRLPLSSAPASLTGANTERDVAESCLQQLRVLAVDDDRAILEVVSRILGECGAEVVTVRSVDGALDVLRWWVPSVLVSDIGMPERDGYVLIREVRRMSHGADVLAIALTAYAGQEDREFALAAGYDAYLVKPVERDRLVRMILSLMRPTALLPLKSDHPCDVRDEAGAPG